jgi:hypothetical protein
LAELRVNGNKLRRVPLSLVSNARLRLVDIGGNAIASWKHVKALRQLPRLASLALKGNPLCDSDDYAAAFEAKFPHLFVLDYVRRATKPVPHALAGGGGGDGDSDGDGGGDGDGDDDADDADTGGDDDDDAAQDTGSDSEAEFVVPVKQPVAAATLPVGNPGTVIVAKRLGHKRAAAVDVVAAIKGARVQDVGAGAAASAWD